MVVGALVAPLDDARGTILPVLHAASGHCRVRRPVRANEACRSGVDGSIEEHGVPVKNFDNQHEFVYGGPFRRTNFRSSAQSPKPHDQF